MNIHTIYTQDEAIAYLLKKLGIQPHLMGYKYMFTAIKLCIEKPDMLDHITKELYPTVARYYGTATSRCERALRHSIEAAFDHSTADSWVYTIFEDLHNDSSGRPCNSLFIATCAQLLTLEPHHPIFELEVAHV